MRYVITRNIAPSLAGIDSLFSDFFSDVSTAKIPPVDIYETDSEYVIEAETDDATLQVGDTVTVCAQRSTGMLAVLLAFVIPFLLILLVLVVLRAWIDNEPLTGTLALASLIPYYMILSLFKGRLKSTFRFYIKKLS